MKIYEIDKSSFHNKLRYEWMEELETRVNNFNAHTAFENGWRVTLLDDPIRLELSRFEGNKTLHTMEIWMGQMIMSPLAVDYPVDFVQTDRSPRSQTKYPSVTYEARPRIKEAKLSKEEFHKRLVDPRKVEVENKLKEFDDILRNRLGWRLDWSEWELDPGVIDVIAYKPRTLPYTTATVDDVRGVLWSLILQPRWDEKNQVMITHEDESEDEITWNFELND